MKLKTKEEHNHDRGETLRKLLRKLKKTGVSCPKCGREMVKADNTILTSKPPKRNVICEKCGHKDVILA